MRNICFVETIFPGQIGAVDLILEYNYDFPIIIISVAVVARAFPTAFAAVGRSFPTRPIFVAAQIFISTLCSFGYHRHHHHNTNNQHSFSHTYRYILTLSALLFLLYTCICVHIGNSSRWEVGSWNPFWSLNNVGKHYVVYMWIAERQTAGGAEKTI